MERVISAGDILGIVTSLMAIIGTLVAWFLRPLWKETREALNWFARFRDDWDGRPESPGHPKVPGVMERMQRIDGQMGRNGGSSLADQVHFIRSDIAEIREDIIPNLVSGLPCSNTKKVCD